MISELRELLAERGIEVAPDALIGWLTIPVGLFPVEQTIDRANEAARDMTILIQDGNDPTALLSDLLEQDQVKLIEDGRKFRQHA